MSNEKNGPVTTRIDPTIRRKRFRVECRTEKGIPSFVIINAPNARTALKEFSERFPHRSFVELFESRAIAQEIVSVRTTVKFR